MGVGGLLGASSWGDTPDTATANGNGKGRADSPADYPDVPKQQFDAME